MVVTEVALLGRSWKTPWSDSIIVFVPYDFATAQKRFSVWFYPD